MEDTFDSVMDDSDVEEEAQEEVDKVLFELTDGLLGATTSSHLPQVRRRLWQRAVAQRAVVAAYRDVGVGAGGGGSRRDGSVGRLDGTARSTAGVNGCKAPF